MLGNLDLSNVFSYLLVPVPLSLGHGDRSTNKTEKSKLMQKLEDMGTGCPPDKVDVTLVDAMSVLHTMQNLPTTCGAIYCMLLRQLCKMSVRVDFATPM